MGTFQIAMVGGNGVGKTSLLAAMYDQFNQVIRQTNLQLKPDRESAALLGEQLANLKEMFDDFEIEKGISGTRERRDFAFGLGKKGESPSITLKFADYPGGYIQGNATQIERDQVYTLMRNSFVSIVTIDTPALMESHGRWNERINRTQQVLNIFQDTYADLSAPRLVLFAPVKCESYIRDAAAALKLQMRIQESYRDLIDLLNSDKLRSQVAVAITPVQTVGTVVFSRIETRNDQPVFFFRKEKPDAKYEPRDSEQPLLYLLRFLLRLHYAAEAHRWGPFSFLRAWFGMDEHLIDSIKTFSNKCKRTGGFKIIQGEEWLKV